MIFDNHNTNVENWSEMYPDTCIDRASELFIECYLSHKSHPLVCIIVKLNLTHHGPVPHICVAIFSANFPSAPDMGRWFQCSFPQCPIHGAWQTARSSPVPQIVVARPHLLSHQRPIYEARHGPLSLHVSCGKYQMLSPIYWLFFPITVFHKV